MKMTKKRMLLAAALGTAVCTPGGFIVAEEVSTRGPYYEDDAWYDITEWFDGNDYNPTDEAFGRIDDERYSFADDATSDDRDNDVEDGETNYGYARRNDVMESTGFYDYYDDGYGTWEQQFFTKYYDVDDDGYYDAYASYTDTDGDGVYDDFEYLSFNDAGSDAQQQARNDSKDTRSELKRAEGQIADTKTVKVRGTEHLVAMVNVQNSTWPVDLGPKSEIQNLNQGDSLTATGHVLTVGDKKILVATEAQYADQTLEVQRGGREFTGKVQNTKTVNVRGTEHQLAKIKTDDGKNLMVDLGPKDRLDNKLQEGKSITVSGVPVKVNDRALLMAREFHCDGETMQIARRGNNNRS
ncbi:hypothetical protein Pan14r_12490 [Crateriforma conspicua]|uniref:Magnetosome protein MamS/MamX domain-containing protein n=2 Tax=Crateriforma conspicua TaxID=2527996 RepID=A0A5C5Y3W7_9PLAN|nr:hypothetical protein Pan14r_12490 [Crateriforma conspicua]